MANSETSADTARPWQSYNTVYTNAKAGMEGVDKERVQRIVYEMSKGSQYFKNEERKEAFIREKIENMRFSRPGYSTEVPAAKLVSIRCQTSSPDGFASKRSMSVDESETLIGSRVRCRSDKKINKKIFDSAVKFDSMGKLSFHVMPHKI